MDSSGRFPARLPAKRIATNLKSEHACSSNKKGSREKTMGFHEMGILRCDGCGEEFFIGHNPQWVDKRIAERQAKWLEKVLTEEHERDRKHPDRIELPD
jgi:ribosomal protein L37AE/L43A